MSFANVITQSQRALALLEDQQNPHSPARFINITRARCIARYKMSSIPGRPEELRTNTIWPERTISFGYAGGELRIRKHGGVDNRAWVDHVDIKLTDGWLDKVYEFLDQWLGYVPATERANVMSFGSPERPRPTDPYAGPGEPFPTTTSGNYGADQPRPRPIKDNPQA